MLAYSDEGVQSIELPDCDHYFDSLDYSLRKIVCGERGITDLDDLYRP
mgnify:CR=1 FL=1